MATATVTDAAGTQTLEVRKDKDKNYYAKSSVVEGVYKITPDLGDALNKGLDDFRNKKLFDFGFSDPTKIELKNGDLRQERRQVDVRREDHGQRHRAEPDRQAARPDAPRSSPRRAAAAEVFEAIVTSNDGKRVEKVTVTKQGDEYFAQREGEPSIYVLDAKAVDDLQKGRGGSDGSRRRRRRSKEQPSAAR